MKCKCVFCDNNKKYATDYCIRSGYMSNYPNLCKLRTAWNRFVKRMGPEHTGDSITEIYFKTELKRIKEELKS